MKVGAIGGVSKARAWRLLKRLGRAQALPRSGQGHFDFNPRDAVDLEKKDSQEGIKFRVLENRFLGPRQSFTPSEKT